MSSSTFRILFIVRKARIDKNKLTTIVIRITIEGDSLEFSSKISIDPTLWDSESGKLTGRTKMAVEANTALEKINSRLRIKYNEIEEKLGYVTPELLKKAFLGVEEKETTLLLLMDKKITQKKSIAGTSIQESAVEKYESTRDKLEEFIAEYSKTKDIGIKQVNYDFIMGFDTFLRSKHHCGHNTTVKYLRYLKQITTEALKSGLLQIDPFMNITLSSKKGYREYLNEEELESIIQADFISEILRETRDIFVFCCYTGFAYIDASKLTIDDIVTKKGKKYIIKNRTKTDVSAFVPLLKTPQKIIAKYQKKNLPGGKLLPMHACQVTNRYLKEIASLCGIGQLTKYLLESKFNVFGYDSDETLVETCSLMYPQAQFYYYDFCKSNEELIALSRVKQWDLIVSNPPSSKRNITSFIGWLSEALSDNGKAIVLMPDDFEYKKYNKFYKTYVERFKILTKEAISSEFSQAGNNTMQIYLMELTEEYKKGRTDNLSNQEFIVTENPQKADTTEKKEQIMDKQDLRKIQNVRLNKIIVNPLNPRKKINDTNIKELAQSIKQIGLLQPITLRRIGEKLEIVAGECRYRAYLLNTEETIPAIIGDYTDAEMMLLALAENMNRNNLSPLEEADAFYYLVSGKQYPTGELSLKFGKNENYIRNRLRLLLLIPDFKNLLENEELSLGASIELSKYSNAVQQEVYETYYQNSSSPLSWINISKKEVANRLVKLYTMNLNDYEFDKSECKKCPYNRTRTLYLMNVKVNAPIWNVCVANNTNILFKSVK